MKKEIIHILPASSPHLTNPIVKILFKRLRNDDLYNQTVVIMGDGYNYDDLLDEFKDKVILVSSFIDLLFYINKHRYHKILMHGDNTLSLLVLPLISNNVNWICWGSSTQKRKNYISRLLFYIRKMMFHRLSSIITLMEEDKKSLIATYNLKKIIVLPYPDVIDSYCKELKHFGKLSNHPIRVLIGNSGHNYDSYLQILPTLVCLKDDIEVHCMFQYPNLEKQKESLRIKGESLFGSSFFIDDKMMNRKEYYDYLASYDIYICHNENQSGLGAIYNMLFFGKKIFLNGRNLSWCRSLGFKVFDSKHLKECELESFVDFHNDDRMLNRNIILTFYNKNENEWRCFLQNC